MAGRFDFHSAKYSSKDGAKDSTKYASKYGRFAKIVQHFHTGDFLPLPPCPTPILPNWTELIYVVRDSARNLFRYRGQIISGK